MPIIWIYSASSAGQKIEGAVDVIVASRSDMCMNGPSYSRLPTIGNGSIDTDQWHRPLFAP